jgi:hypothetical protein
MSDTPANELLQKRLAELLNEAREVDMFEVAQKDPSRLLLLLAARFEYDVRKGGFAQLLYNLKGNFLAEMEDMLVAASAPVAREYYVRALKACLDNGPDYQRFLASHFPDPNPLKDALHRVSLEYFAEHVSFDAEAEVFLTRGRN